LGDFINSLCVVFIF